MTLWMPSLTSKRMTSSMRLRRLLRGAVVDDAAVFDADDSIGLVDDALIVRREDESGALLLFELLHPLDDRVPVLRIEVRRRLVGEHEARLRHERARDRDALTLPARQLVG